jgi:hypothetical protein
MDPILENLSACRFKTKMDLQAGFWQVRLSDSAKSLTAFILPDQTVFRVKVLPMGLSVSPGVFQSFTSRHVRNFKQDPVVQHLLSSGSVVEVMVDDFVLGSPSRAEHLQLLRLWLKYAVDNCLYFKRAKCVFMQPSLEVLGHWVGFRQWGPLPNKLEKIIVKKPTCVAELRSLLGSVNWIRRHVTDIRPTYVLSELLKKNKKWNWQEIHEQAWNDLKDAVLKATAVCNPVPNAPMLLVTDASEEGGGGTLLQLQKGTEGEKDTEERYRFSGHWGWK